MKNLFPKKSYSIITIVLMMLLSISVVSQSIKFHPIGDSTTEAYELESAWRYWFYKLLIKNGYNNVDFVGSRKGTNKGTSFSDNNWDMDHDGHTSSTALQVLNGGLANGHSGSIKVWAPQYTPQIAVIYLGTNDIRQGRSSADIIKTFQDIIQVLRNARKEVKIVVCQIPNWSYSGYGGSQAGVNGLNALIPSLANLGTDISPIKIVDLNTGYYASDHRDGIHPGPTGAPKIADRIYTAVEPWLKGTSETTVKITSPASNQQFELSSAITISADASSTKGTIAKVEFFNGTTKIGEDLTVPYSKVWSSTTSGTFILTAKATDNVGNSTTSSPVTIKIYQPQAPYGGSPHPIPGIIQTEEFDLGGNGVAYNDDSPGSSVIPIVNFRTGEDVDIENCSDAGGGYNIGYAKAGEWLEYTVNVATSGKYDLFLRVACDGASRTLNVELGGKVIANALAVPNTAGWQNWQTISVKNVQLTAGVQVMRLTIGSTSYINLNYVEFKTVVTALEGVQNSKNSVYPNPFSNQGLHVQVERKSIYQILDMRGDVVEQGDLEHESIVGTSIDQGLYILKIDDETGVQTYKVSKQ